MVPCLIREDFVFDEVDGQIYTYCSDIAAGPTRSAFGAEYRGPADTGYGPLQRPA